jgi:uncharacterized protein (DUF58 family)
MPVATIATVIAVWGLIAHDSGAGWVQAIGALVGGALVVGMLGPAVALSRVRCRIVTSPPDASAGARVGLEVSSSSPVEVTPLDPPGPAVVTGRRGRVTLEIRPSRRGVLHHCTVALASAAPFGILWWTRTVTLTLPRPLAVAPRIGREEDPHRLARGVAVQPRAAPGRGAEPRGLRPYERGDRPALVHWRATAHTGSLMVRETERHASDGAVVDGRLPSDPGEAERQGELVMATVHALLLAGTRVELVTVEPGGEVVAPVASLLDAGRRLASSLPHVEPSESAR